MGKEVQQKNFYKFRRDNHQGRFWGMFHALDYHHWGCVKKLLHNKNVGKNRFRCCIAPRTVSFNFANGEEHVDDESEHLLGNNHSLDFSSSKKIHSEETSQELVISNPILVFHGAAHLRLIDERVNRRFIKTRSFPAPRPDYLGTKICRSSTMNHKQNEVWLFPKGEKRNTVTVDSPKGNKSEQIGKDSTSKHGWKINPFKSIKKKIKRVFQETRKEETKEKDVGINKTKQTRVTRLSSLNESIDKYTRLFEGSYGNEASKLGHAKSLKLAAEESKVKGHIVQKSLRRGFSLPSCEALDSLLAEKARENLQSRQENLRSGSLTTKTYKDSKILEMIDEQESIEDDSRIEFVDDSFDGSEIDIDLNAESPSIRRENEGDDHCDEATNVENVSKLTMGELQPTSPDSVLVPFSPLEDSTTNVATSFDNLIETRIDPVKEKDPNFNFVREILNSAGFLENEPIPTWDSIHLPLNPTLYDEPEGTEDPELMFDLINEALLEIYQRSFTYFPRVFSFNPFTRPITKGKHVVDEVWRVVKFYKEMKPELDVTIDNIVARDMARQDGWVNYGLDNEFVALELEELILNELVDELLDVLH